MEDTTVRTTGNLETPSYYTFDEVCNIRDCDKFASHVKILGKRKPGETVKILSLCELHNAR